MTGLRPAAAAIALTLGGGWSAPPAAAQATDARLRERDATIASLEAKVASLAARVEALESEARQQPTRVLDSTRRSPVTNDTTGPGALAIDEASAERALERILNQEGALLLATGEVEISPSLTWSSNQESYPVAKVAGGRLLLGTNVLHRTVISANLDARIGLPFGAQVEIGIPYRRIDNDLSTRIEGAPAGQAASQARRGFGNLHLGLAKTLVRERGAIPDVVARLTWDTDIGGKAESDILGGGGQSLTGSLSFVKRSDPLAFIGSASYRTYLGGGRLRQGDQIGFSLGAALAASPHTTLFASVSNQFLGDAEIDGGAIAGSGLTAVSLNLGAGAVIGRGALLNVIAGIGVTDDAPDYSLGLATSFRIR